MRDLDTATAIAKDAGDLALDFFRKRESLVVEAKGRQDWVTIADRDVESLIRRSLEKAFPGDAIVGEEHGRSTGSNDYTWVIDPIDGTANFVAGIPLWCIVLASMRGGKVDIAIIHDPIHGETFAASAGGGATLNGTPIATSSQSLENGTISMGYSNRAKPGLQVRTIASVLATGAKFHRNASGALTLAYVAAGRILGYMEQHMNAWDCLAGQLLVQEAGGRIEDQNADMMISDGGRVIASAPQVFDEILGIAETHWTDE